MVNSTYVLSTTPKKSMEHHFKQALKSLSCFYLLVTAYHSGYCHNWRMPNTCGTFFVDLLSSCAITSKNNFRVMTWMFLVNTDVLQS